MYRRVPLSGRAALALAAALGALLVLGACGDGDEEAVPTESAQPSGISVGASTTPLQTSNCEPGDGPPQEGAGAEGLEGRLTYVRLVFGCQPDIYIMDADGSGSTQLTDDPGLDDESDLSPDGSRVAFFSGREGNAYIYIVSADGSDLRRITEGMGGDVSPRWSPDGSRIAFSRSGTLMVMNADGSDQKTIMEPQPAATAEPCRAGSFVGSWAPAGDRIVYYSAAVVQDAKQTRYWVCAINADGSGMEVLVGEPAGGLHAEPYWSPDGDKIAYRDDGGSDCTSAAGCNFDIFVLDLSTGEKTNVTDHPLYDIEPGWSPDGEWVIFASNREDPNFDLYVVHPDGTGLQRVLSDPDSKDSYPSWR
ncbi:MAG TPA: hypothetical protein VGR43_08410 [Dehalococcoidia bacterium]|jgi:TolB protein|nr:hypothetical protein [Dehalococcoidia bacterium]